jgi:1-acyl-sn-glycerol-3-phosphate acyltransferase
LPFKKGAFYMAAQARVPIVPVAIKNTDVMMGKGTGVAKSGTIEFVLLPPISTAGVSTDDEVNQLVQHVHRVVERELSVRGASWDRT